MTEEEQREYSRNYYLENKEEIKQQRKKHYLENKERLKEKARKYAVENPEKISQYQKKHYLENKETRNQYQREYYLKNKDEIDKKHNEYNQNNPEKIKCHVAVREALRTGRIVKPNKCSNPNCNNTNKIESHHPDYSKELEVMWLCRSCHGLLRKNNNKRNN